MNEFWMLILLFCGTLWALTIAKIAKGRFTFILAEDTLPTAMGVNLVFLHTFTKEVN